MIVRVCLGGDSFSTEKLSTPKRRNTGTWIPHPQGSDDQRDRPLLALSLRPSDRAKQREAHRRIKTAKIERAHCITRYRYDIPRFRRLDLFCLTCLCGRDSEQKVGFMLEREIQCLESGV